MRIIREDGWIKVPFTGHNLARVYIAVSKSNPDDSQFQPAFHDFVSEGRSDKKVRVVQIRDTGQSGSVWVKVDGVVTPMGTIR